MSRKPFLINATELRVVLGSQGCLYDIHDIFETIWRRYHPEVFDQYYHPAAAALVATKVAVAVPTPFSSSSSSRIAQRCVRSRLDGVSFSLYQRTVYDRLALLYRERMYAASAQSRGTPNFINTLSRQNGILFEAEVLRWFHRILWPQIQKKQRQAQLVMATNYNTSNNKDNNYEGNVSEELQLVQDSAMYYRFMGFVRAPSDGLLWWLRGKVDGKLVAQHHRFRTGSSSSSSSSRSTRPRVQVIEVKVHNELYQRETELLQLLAYLLLLDVESGYLVQSSLLCGAESGQVDVTMTATHVQSDEMIWSRWIVPRMNQLLSTIHWLTQHTIAAQAYFRLTKSARNVYVDQLLQSAATLRMPSLCRVPG